MPDLSRGACAGMADATYASEDVFFPEPGRGRPTSDPYEEARAICARCPLTAECLQDALTEVVQWGFRAGLTGEERQSLKRKERRANAVPKQHASLTERKAMYDQKWSDSRIAAAQGVRATAIQAWRLANNLPSHHVDHRVHSPEQTALKFQMWESGATDSEIADAVPCKPDAVRKWRSKNGLKVNPERERVSA